MRNEAERCGEEGERELLTLSRVGEEPTPRQSQHGGLGVCRALPHGINTPTGNLHHLTKSQPAPGTGQILPQLTALPVLLTGWRCLEAATNFRILLAASGEMQLRARNVPQGSTDPSALPNGSVLV